MSLSYRIAPGVALRQLTRPTTTPTLQACAATQTSKRYRSDRSESWYERNSRPDVKPKHQPTQTAVAKKMYKDLMRQGNTALFPMTFARLPITEFPRSPVPFLKYTWTSLKGWMTGLTTLFQVKLQSMDKWNSRPRWRARRGLIATTGQVMYRDALLAFARGDKQTLANLCTPHFATQMHAVLDRRPKNQRVTLDIAERRPWGTPALRSHLIGVMNVHDRNTLREQAVVYMESTQHVTRETLGGPDGKSVLRSESKEERNKGEYVVLVRDVSARDWTSTSWKIWGTTAGTSLEGGQEQYEKVIAEHKRQAGWKV